LLKAFKQDATKNRYVDWADLLDYCAHSASPVGRFLLDLHGEDKALYGFSDPLCDALQILNHLQDCQDDFRQLDRVYLPLDLLAKAGIDETALKAPGTSPALRQVLNTILDHTDDLLQRASDLPAALISRRLGAESAVILDIARELSHQLRRCDPLSERVELSKPAFAMSAIKGLGRLKWLKRGRHRGLPAGTGAMR
jgi:phytoene/squalene synthetase